MRLINDPYVATKIAGDKVVYKRCRVGHKALL